MSNNLNICGITQNKLFTQKLIVRRFIMKKKYSFISIVVVLTISVFACQFNPVIISTNDTIRGSGIVVEEERTVRDFNSVTIRSFGNLIIEFGDEESLRIEAEDNLMEYIETDVRGDTLVFSTKNGYNLKPSEPVRYYLTMVELEEILIYGSGDIEASVVDVDQLSIKIWGSGDIEFDELMSDEFKIEIFGSGDININSGKVTEEEIRIPGSGDVSVGDLRAESADVKISGSGDVTVWVTDYLKVRILGSGNVKYYGDPSVDLSASGSGDIRDLGDR
jgi:hypothetical protein